MNKRQGQKAKQGWKGAMAADLHAVQNQRFENAELQKAIYGCLAYLEDNQIRARKKKHHSFYSYSEAKKGSKSKVVFNIPFRGKIRPVAIPMFLKVRNLEGEWASQIHFLPKKMGSNGRTFVTVQDSNMFVTAFSAFPLYYFSENLKKGSEGILDNILDLVQKNINLFKRGQSYNFWKAQDAHYGTKSRVGPLNIWIPIAGNIAQVYKHPRLRSFVTNFTDDVDVPPPDWVERCLDDDQNPNGADALFNITNDADDSSMALVMQYLSRQYNCPERKVEFKVLEELSTFRDIGRNSKYELGQDGWKGKDSGAFLTWLKDETLSTFDHVEMGVIPGGKNSVDIVVNANVIFAMSLLDRSCLPGFDESCDLLVRAIEEKKWPEAGLYYPQLMIFPYAVSRAIRDGQVKHEGLLSVRTKLMRDVLRYGSSYGKSSDAIYFPGGVDHSADLSTALAVNTLLNLGEEVAEQANCLPGYHSAIEGGIKYLLSKAKYASCKFEESRKVFAVGRKDKIAASWEDGLFFSSAYWDFGQWRSTSVTTSAVMEAMVKYLLAYDKDLSQSLKASQTLHGVKAPLDIKSLSLADFQRGQWLEIA